ncbi:MAG: hypothetical protein A2Y38_24905 [Spirochaetes bacterium GWB1_59_5]|nr:MAG: hypothetical protein A2Y38_24905 [Spirochaetes bacterium GWB1_59_5]
MALTKRKDILDQLLYRLGQIRLGSIYGTDLLTVARQRDTGAEPFSPEECWAANVRDGQATVQHNVSDDEHALPVSIELHASSRVTLAEAETALADLVHCIDTYNNWGGYADGTNLESHEIDIIQTGDIITAVLVDITINYTTDKGKI